jgi:hypothetical protein
LQYRMRSATDYWHNISIDTVANAAWTGNFKSNQVFMKLKNWLFISGAIIMFSSCGENSTTEATKDSTASATVADNTAVAPASVDVPATTRANFETKYPGASNVTWSYYDEPYNNIDWEWTAWPVLDKNDYLVRYNWNGADYYSWYDQDGNWVGSVTSISDYNGLPAPVNASIKKEFPGYTITGVDKENDKDKEVYEVKLENGSEKARALIGADGKVWKKKGAESKEKAEVK